AVQPVLQQSVKNKIKGLPVFEGFAIGQLDEEHLLAGGSQRVPHTVAIQRSHLGVGHHRDRRGVGGYALGQTIQASRAYVYRIGAAGRTDLHCGHDCTSCCCNKGTSVRSTCGTGMVPVSKMKLATLSYSGSRSASRA